MTIIGNKTAVNNIHCVIVVVQVVQGFEIFDLDMPASQFIINSCITQPTLKYAIINTSLGSVYSEIIHNR